MEETKLDNLMILTGKIEERIATIDENQKNTHVTLNELVKELHNLKLEINNTRVQDLLVINQISHRISAVENEINSIKSKRKDGFMQILHIVIEIIIGVAILYVGANVIENRQLIEDNKNVESNR